MIGVVVYSLCAVVSFACAVLLTRGYRRSRTPLLFWSSISFAFLALNNVLLALDMVIFADVDLQFWRTLAALVGLGVLVYGFVTESR